MMAVSDVNLQRVTNTGYMCALPQIPITILQRFAASPKLEKN
jgi:hypothetical protein